MNAGSLAAGKLRTSPPAGPPTRRTARISSGVTPRPEAIPASCLRPRPWCPRSRPIEWLAEEDQCFQQIRQNRCARSCRLRNRLRRSRRSPPATIRLALTNQDPDRPLLADQTVSEDTLTGARCGNSARLGFGNGDTPTVNANVAWPPSVQCRCCERLLSWHLRCQ